MNNAWQYIGGFALVQIEGVGTDLVLNALTKNYVPFWDPHLIDEFTLQIKVFPKDVKKVEHVAQRALCEVHVRKHCGFSLYWKHILHRPMLLCGTLCCLILVFILQNYILFYNVVGNASVPEQQILRALEEIGVGFGTYGPDIKPKWIKDHILNELPQLQWITVTQNGSSATVTVRQRPEIPQIADRRKFTNIVASRPGLITQMSVLEGQAMKEPGDTVLEGELLVSGVVDLERMYKIVCARAEIYARTWHEKTTVIPAKASVKRKADDREQCIWLQIGKRRIKIFGNSGISYTDCDKMISTEILTLPGGRKLPVSFIVEHFAGYNRQPYVLTFPEAQLMLSDYSARTVKEELLAGEILNEQSDFMQKNGCYRQHSMFECLEMIAEPSEGKWNKEDFEHD